MRVLSFLPRHDLKRRVEKALSSAQFVVETVGSAKECSYSTRRAHYDGVLVDSDSLDFKDTLDLIKHLRRENADASLFVFARYPDLEQRLALFEAGVDDYVREPFFASEMTVRFGLSIRLRRAASGVTASRTVNKLSLRRSRTGFDSAQSRAAGQGNRPAAKRIPPARIPAAECEPPGYTDHDSGACMELILRRFNQRSRCVYQLVTK